MKISIIIPAYNSAEYIKEAVDSALNQAHKDTEIIVVDDGSTDSTKDILKDYIKKKKIIYIYQKNRGQGAARNTGIMKSKGKLIAFLDADDIWTEDKLEKQAKLFEDSSVGLVYGGVEWFNRERSIKKSLPNARGKIFSRLINHNLIATSTVVMRKDAFKGFNEDRIFHGVEDYDLWLRTSKYWKIDFVRSVICRYRVHEKGISVDLEKRYINELAVKKQHFRECSKRLIRESLWDTNFNTAYAYNKQKDYGRSMAYLRRAFRNLPFELKNYKLLAKNLLKFS